MTIRKPSGYTLIEILVVIVIISIVSTVALLTVGHNQNRRMESVARQFTQMLTLAEEQAMLQPAVLGLSVTGSSFQFLTYQTHWVPLQDKALASHSLPDNIVLTLMNSRQLEDTDDSDEVTPQIVISTNGNVTPFTLYIGKQGEAPRYVVTGEADGTIESHMLS